MKMKERKITEKERENYERGKLEKQKTSVVKFHWTFFQNKPNGRSLCCVFKHNKLRPLYFQL